MQFLPAKNKGPLLLALATLLLIALALAASSLQTLHQQRRAMDGHLLLAARSVHAAMAGALRRRPLQEGELPLVPGAMAFMQELKTESGVHFLGVYSPEGERLFLPLFDEDARRFRLPDRALSLLEEEGEFKGVEPAGTLQLFVYGRDMGPPGCGIAARLLNRPRWTPRRGRCPRAPHGSAASWWWGWTCPPIWPPTAGSDAAPCCRQAWCSWAPPASGCWGWSCSIAASWPARP
ncbi:MAG: hypothetical protein LDL27_05830 [Desulfovibrio sp.]|nr:hypothetical protein [Desulfovibrio sp.]